MLICIATIPSHIRTIVMQIHQNILQSAACECPCASVGVYASVCMYARAHEDHFLRLHIVHQHRHLDRVVPRCGYILKQGDPIMVQL